MIEYMKRHELYVREILAKNPSPEALKDLLKYHDKQIQWMQHERLVHLLTMLFVCLFALLSMGYALFNPSAPCFILSGLLIILSVAYVIHYYRLENGVQKWYRISNEIRGRL
jgi:cell division protein FtsW (lipid II flippase)